MYRFHRTPFEEIIGNILNITTKYNAAFTFPTVASTAIQKPELLREIISAKSEIAIHGYQHLKYPLISKEEQRNDLRMAVKAYRKLSIPINGFRAPYNAYNSSTLLAVDEQGFAWDAGIGYSRDYNSKTDFFKVTEDNRELRFVCIPLNELSDDLLIDEFHYSTRLMTKSLKGKLDWIRESHGVIMFDLHPIRIGQPNYVSVLEDLISYGTSIGGWFPTVSEAVERKMKKGDWNGHEFCCLLTGDIDNFYFRDYLRRLT